MNYQWLLWGKEELPDLIMEPLSHYGEFIGEHQWQNKVDSYMGNVGTMLVINCSGGLKDSISDKAADIKDMLNNDHPVLLLMPTAEIKNALVQSQVIPCCIDEDSVALFIEPCRDVNGELRISLAEQFGPAEENQLERMQVIMDQSGKILSEKSDSFEITEPVGLDFLNIDPFIGRIRKTMHTLAAGNTVSFGEVQPNTPPSGVPSTLWINTPITIYAVDKPGGKSEGSFTPPTGQTTIEFLVSVGIYYDNKKYGPSKPVQWVYLEHSGHAHTTMQRNDSDCRGWSIGEFIFSGDNISSSEFISNSSAPNNVSGTTTYTSESSLNVGLQAGTEGIAGDIGYTIGSSENITITDWKVLQLDTNSWKMYQNSPFSGDVEGFPDGCAGNDGVNELPDISKSTLKYNTQTTWIHNPASSSSVKKVSYNYSLKSFFTWCDSHSSTSWHAWNWWYKSNRTMTITLDFSKAYPKSKK